MKQRVEGLASEIGAHSGARRGAAGWGRAHAAAFVGGRRRLAQAANRLRGNLWIALDAGAVVCAVLLAHVLSPSYLGDPLGAWPVRIALGQAAAFVVAGYACGLYDWNVLGRRGLIVRRALLAALLAVTSTVAFSYLVFYRPIGRWVLGYGTLLSGLLTIAPRLMVWRLLRQQPRRVLFLGDSPLSERTAAALEHHYQRLYDVVRRPLSLDDLPGCCLELDIDEIILPQTPDRLSRLIPEVLHCLPLGCQVRSEADFYEDTFRSVPAEFVTPDWLMGVGWDTSNHFAEAAKRASDALLALALLVLAAPAMLMIALLVRLADGGPALYSQVRLGRYGRPFRILKFRTMRVGAESGEALWAKSDDPRQTRLGRILRRARLDELPQLLNILRGEMSFVGPRPERPEFVESLERELPYYAWRHLVRPGLTGWAQINYPYGSSVEDARRKLEFDLYYIRHYSLITDLLIVLRTVTAALQGAR